METSIRGGSGRGTAVILSTVLEVGLEIFDFGFKCADVVFQRFEMLLCACFLGRFFAPGTLGFEATKAKRWCRASSRRTREEK